LNRPRDRDAGHSHALPDVATAAITVFAVQIVIYGVGFVGSVVISRALGPSGRGIYQLPVTAAIVAFGLGHLSVEPAADFMFAERRYSLGQLARNTTTDALLIGPVTVAAMAAFYLLTRHTVFAKVPLGDYLLVAMTVPITFHVTWMANIFVLGGRIRQSQLALLAGAVAQTTGCIALAVLGQLTVLAVLILYAVGCTVPWVIMVLRAKGFVSLRPSVRAPVTRDVLTFGLRVHVGLVGWFLLLRSDVFLVSVRLGARAVGLYTLAVLLAELVWLLTQPLVVAALPRQSATSAEEALPLTFKTVRFNVGLAILLAAGLAVTLPVVIPAFFGASFAGSYAATVVLMPGVIAMAAGRPLFNWLIRTRGPLALAGISFGALAGNVALNVVLLKPLGIVGASLASTVAYTVVAVTYVVMALRTSNTRARDALLVQPDDVRTVRTLIERLRRRGGPGSPDTDPA
jgi:O-antigen/teichoic acid export membrane protein